MNNNLYLKNQNNAIRLFIVLVFFQFSCTSCNDIECPDQPYSDKLEYELSPEKKEYSLNDTIWLNNKWNIDIPIMNSKNTYSVKNCNGYLNIILVNIKNRQSVEGKSDFDYIMEEGQIIKEDPSRPITNKYELNMNYSCGDEYCKFKFGIIPKKIGSYCITLHINNISRPDTTLCSDKIRILKTIPKVNSLNKEVLLENGGYDFCLPYDGSGCGYLEMDTNETTYCFNVK